MDIQDMVDTILHGVTVDMEDMDIGHGDTEDMDLGEEVGK